MSTTNYETTITLPSKGLLYKDIPEDITIRAITTAEEKMIFGSTSSNSIERMMKACIVEPKNIDFKELLPFDEEYIMLKLRAHTYGSEYKIGTVCPHCGEQQEAVMNLDELPVEYLKDDFVEPFTITLPKCGNTLEVRLLRNKDYEAARNQAKKIAKKVRGNAKELAYTIRMAKHIVKIDGEEVDEGKAQQFCEGLLGYDAAYFWAMLDEAVQCGVDSEIEHTCQNCGEDYSVEFQMSSEFFRPKFK